VSEREGWHHRPIRIVADRPHLTAREREVIILAGCGLTARGTGLALHITTNTVKVHRARALLALHATDMANALALAIVQNVITREELAEALEKRRVA